VMSIGIDTSTIELEHWRQLAVVYTLLYASNMWFANYSDSTGETYSHHDKKDQQPKNKRKKRTSGGPPVGIDNIRLTPAAFSRSPIERLAEKNKNAKIRRNKRGSVQELTQAFADKDDEELTKQHLTGTQLVPSSSEPKTVSGDDDCGESSSAAVVSETGNSFITNNGLNNNNNNNTPVVETKKPSYVPLFSRRRQSVDNSQLPATTLRTVPPHTVQVDRLVSTVNRQTSSMSAPFDDDEPFPPPPIIGYVNHTFQQFDPPHSSQQRQNQSDVPNQHILLTQNSFGESQTDVVDVQHNPLFDLLPVK